MWAPGEPWGSHRPLSLPHWSHCWVGMEPQVPSSHPAHLPFRCNLQFHKPDRSCRLGQGQGQNMAGSLIFPGEGPSLMEETDNDIWCPFCID